MSNPLRPQGQVSAELANAGLENLDTYQQAPKAAPTGQGSEWGSMDQGGFNAKGQDQTDESDMSQLQFIVQELNKTLNEGQNFSLVSFDRRKGRSLLQVLNDVLTSLSPSMRMDVQAEDPQETAARLENFLCAILNYRPTCSMQEFQQGLLSGKETVIYPILAWVLKRMPENAKRVYLAKYLIPVQVPEEMTVDDAVGEVYKQYKQLVVQFKEIHKTVTKLESESNKHAKGAVNSLEQDKEQLTARVAAVEKKLMNFPNHEARFRASQKLRKAKEEEMQLIDAMNEQTAYRKSTEMRISQAEKRLQDVKADFGEMNINKMMASLRDEIGVNKKLLDDQLPNTLNEMREKVDICHRQLTDPLDGDMLKRQVQALEGEIQNILDKSRPKLTAAEESSLGLFRQQAALVGSRKEKLLEEMAELKQERTKLQTGVQQREMEFRSFKGAKILKGDEFKAFANVLRGKSTKYKKLKNELQELKAEMGIIQRTDELLTQKSETLNAEISTIEKAKGIDGYRNMKDGLVAVSESKMETDEAKGKTLEELSKVVQEFVSNIRNKRNKLAPQILELRNTRQRSQAVEQEWQQKKEVYEGIRQELEDEIDRLQTDYNTYRDDCHMYESLHHRLNCQINILEVQNKRVQDEREFKSGARKLNERYKTYSEMLDHQISQLEGVSKELRERQKDIEQNHEANLQQMEYFRDLKRLLECKMTFNKREAAGHVGSQLAGVDMGGALNNLGVDRLVLPV